MNPAEALAEFLTEHPRVLVLTGAGISTASGIPDYRDRNGDWKSAAPVQYKDFVGRASVRQRYWSRSLLGWPRMAEARANVNHETIAWLQRAGYADTVVTQNVDMLHQRAGATRVIDLHGRLDTVSCLSCDFRCDRDEWQRELDGRNPDFAASVRAVRQAPDGDAQLEGVDYSAFAVPGCPTCGGIIKPDVVFFGENVPRPRVAAALDALAASMALLVIGSSLIVFSGFRFAREAARRGQPIALVNQGYNRADDLATLKLDTNCESVLSALPGLLIGRETARS